MTGGRLKRVAKYLGDEDFCFTYGDGLSDVNISELVRFHKEQGSLATVTAVQPPGRFGLLDVQGDKVVEFNEKPLGDGGWINGGYFVLSPKVIERIEEDATSWESEPLKGLAADGELTIFKHKGFWQPMDTLRDKNQLEELWDVGKAPWRGWCLIHRSGRASGFLSQAIQALKAVGSAWGGNTLELRSLVILWNLQLCHLYLKLPMLAKVCNPFLVTSEITRSYQKRFRNPSPMW